MGFFVPLAAAGLARLRQCSGESRCRKVVCRGGKRSVAHPIREYEGEIFTDYYFGEANTANKSDKLHNNAKSENLNWGGFPGCYTAVARALPQLRPSPSLLLSLFLSSPSLSNLSLFSLPARCSHGHLKMNLII